jgi:uncharacterized membrane protein YphA (DoxX/SURF4 family)
MSSNRKDLAILLLHWTVGVIVAVESALFALSSSTARHLAHIGLPTWIGPALGGIELVAALLFLLPAASRVGGLVLLVIFTVAIVLHFFHGEYNVGALIVYAAAVWAVLATQRNRITGVPA